MIELTCPRCHAPLDVAEPGALRCTSCPAFFPRRAEVPVLLDDGAWAGVVERLDREAFAIAQYSEARRHSVLNMLYYDWWVARMFEAVPAADSGAALELMGGEAELCRRLPARFPAAAALDMNARMIESAARAFRDGGETRVTAVCGDAMRLPFAAGTFSVVLVQGGFHHVRPIMNEVLLEVRRVLRKGGLLVASEPANDAFITTAIRRWQYEHSELQGNDPEEDGFARSEIVARLEKTGFSLETYENFAYVAYPLMANMDLLPLLARSRSRALGRSLMKLDDALERIPFLRKHGWLNLFTARSRSTA